MAAISIINQLVETRQDSAYLKTLDAMLNGSEDRWKIVRRGYLSPEILMALAQDDDEELRAEVAAYPRNLPLEVVKLLAKDSSDEVRLSLSNRRQPLPNEILTILAGDDCHWVKDEILHRCQKLPYDVLDLLARDKDEEIRLGVAERCENDELPIGILYILAQDKSFDVKEEILCNCEIEKYPGVLCMLADDSDPKIRRRARDFIDTARQWNKKWGQAKTKELLSGAREEWKVNRSSPLHI